MKFMIILRGNEEIEGGAMPTEQMLDEMTKFNEELVDAGVMIGGEGLHPAKEGTTVTFKDGKPTVTKGASPGVLAGFWLWKLNSVEDAIDWVKRIPNAKDEHNAIEIRQIFETEEFSGIMSPEAMEQEKRLYQRIAEQNAKAASAD
jgi:hypothetical protein